MFEVSNGISRGFYKRLQQSIKVLPKGTTAETVGTIIESVKDASKMAWLEYKTNQKKATKEELLAEIVGWDQRLSGQQFHGGNLPDKADFFMFSCLEAS